MYTTDPAMAMQGQKVMPIQGGFLLVKPDMVVYESLCDIVRKVGLLLVLTGLPCVWRTVTEPINYDQFSQ